MPKLNRVSTILKRAANLLKRKDLSKRLYARDAEGFDVPTVSRNAVAFCAYGAIARIQNLPDGRQGADSDTGKYFSKYIEETYEDDTVVTFNDNEAHTKDDIIKELRKAAEQARKDGL